LNLKANNGETALIMALKRHNSEIFKILILASADVNLKCKQGFTQLINSVNDSKFGNIVD
jgi:ankyrin repeat protein